MCLNTSKTRHHSTGVGDGAFRSAKAPRVLTAIKDGSSFYMLTINAKLREVIGKKVKALREKGFIPAVVYGEGKPADSIELNLGEFQKVWKEAGESSIIELDMNGQKKNVLIKDVQIDPIKDTPIHVDLYSVRMDKLIEAMVPLNFIGEAPAVKNLGGVLVKVIYELEVEALPANLPSELEVNISKLATFEDRFLVSDLKFSEGVKVLANRQEIIALVEGPHAEEEEALVEEPGLEKIEVVGEKGKEEKAEEGREKKEEA